MNSLLGSAASTNTNGVGDTFSAFMTASNNLANVDTSSLMNSLDLSSMSSDSSTIDTTNAVKTYLTTYFGDSMTEEQMDNIAKFYNNGVNNSFDVGSSLDMGSLFSSDGSLDTSTIISDYLKTYFGDSMSDSEIAKLTTYYSEQCSESGNANSILSSINDTTNNEALNS